MEASVAYVVIDTVDPDAITPFWCAVLGVDLAGAIEDGQYVILTPAKNGVRVSFQRVPEAAFLGERLQPAQWLGALLLMGGIYGLGRDMSHGGAA